MRKLIGATTLFLLLSLAVLAGCNSRITQENYNRIEVGMTYDQVVELLGKPDTCDSAMAANSCTWGDKDKYINIKFVGGNVVLFSSKGL